jgi:hypothetical protein
MAPRTTCSSALDARTGAVIKWEHKLGTGVMNTVVPLSATRVLTTDFDGQGGAGRSQALITFINLWRRAISCAARPSRCSSPAPSKTRKRRTPLTEAGKRRFNKHHETTTGYM